MSLRLDHIGIAVPDLEAARAQFSTLLDLPASPVEEIASEGVRVSFFEVEGCRIELLAPTSPDSPIHRFLTSGRAGVHHISFAAEPGGLPPLLERFLENGVQVLLDTTGQHLRPAADDKHALFLRPREAAGVLLEFTAPRGLQDQ